MRLNPGFRLRHAHNHRPSARDLLVGDFRDELHVQAEAPALLVCHLIEEVNYVATESVLGAAALLKIEGAGRIHFQFWRIAQDRAQFALEIERSLPHLRHSQSHNVIRHRSNRAWQEAPGLSSVGSRPSSRVKENSPKL